MNKKIVLGVFFIVLAAGTIFGAFYLKNYMMLSEGTTKVPLDVVSDIKAIFGENEEYFDYRNVLIDRTRLLPAEDTSLTIIHFWASWCEPCITEIPELLKFIKEKNNANGGDGTKFIIVSLDESFDDLTRFLKNFPDLDQDPILRVWDSTDNLSKKLSIDKLPATIFLKKNFELKRVHGIVDWKSIDP